jgi:hypothetical protein
MRQIANIKNDTKIPTVGFLAGEKNGAKFFVAARIVPDAAMPYVDEKLLARLVDKVTQNNRVTR